MYLLLHVGLLAESRHHRKMDQLPALAAMLLACSGVLLGASAMKRAKRLEIRIQKLEKQADS